jgi:GxxExxY protein
LDSNQDHALTEKVIGLAMKIHRTLGPGFLESVYVNALAYELRRAGLKIDMGERITVRYEDVIVGDFVADFVINGHLICEVKAMNSLSKANEVQLVNYLTATNRDFGLLLNFGAPSLQFKRKYRRSAPDAQNVGLHHPVNPV